MIPLLKMNLTYDSFGGSRKVMDFLFQTGLLNNVCEGCHKAVPVEYESERTFPRLACPDCAPRPSCRTQTALDWSRIKDVPLFLFVAQCYALHVSTKAIVSLSGADYRTVKGYIESIQKALCEKVKTMREEGQLKLGGPGKVVEVDELFVCSRKYGRGKRMAKEETWILGLTEVDAGIPPDREPRP